MTEWRYIAQRALTNEFLDMDLPLQAASPAWALSGAGALQVTVSPNIGNLRAPDGRLLLEEWGTLIYAEANGEIRWGGIVISSAFNGEEWAVECAGFTTYPHGIPYTGDYSKIQIDPTTAFRHIWSHVQAAPDGDLGVTVTGDSTPVRIGTPAVAEVKAANGTVTTEAVEAEPYALAWWESPDCGSELDSLASSTPFDYVERHRWSGDTILHEVEIGYPRLGRRRTDLSFVQGDNVIDVITPTISGDEYANEIVGIGVGEGKKSVRRTTAVRDGRLRRPYVYTAKDVARTEEIDARIRRELARRLNALTITEVTVRNHPNAVIGSWDLGDDVLIEATLPWLGDVALWCRITGWTLLSEDTAKLSLARSDSFTYGA